MTQRPEDAPRRRPLRCALGGCGGCGCLAGIVLVAVMALTALLTRGAAEGADAHLRAVREGRVVEAYAACSDAFRQRVPRERFERFVEVNPRLYQATALDLPDRELDDGRATLTGKATGPAGAQEVRFVLIHERGAWRVHHVELPGEETEEEASPAGADGGEHPASRR